jgi:hypothetical protein
LPPAYSSRGGNAEEFFDTLVAGIYKFQDNGIIQICGDFNARIGDTVDFIEGVDDVKPRNVIDFCVNSQCKPFIDFCVSANMCCLNGRNDDVTDNFTCVSTKGKSVVDYCLVPYDEFNSFSKFEVSLVQDLIAKFNVPIQSAIPDHSMLSWVFKTTSVVPCSDNSDHVNETDDIISLAKLYDLSDIPDTFLMDEVSVSQAQLLVDEINSSQFSQDDVDDAYNKFECFVKSSVVNNFRKKNCKRGRINNKGMRHTPKPWWNQSLQTIWDDVCCKQKVWLRCNNPLVRGTLFAQYKSVHKQFDKAVKKAKRQYQYSKINDIDALLKNDPVMFWKEIGKIGVTSCKQRNSIPMEVISDNGETSDCTDHVLDKWGKDFKSLFKSDNKQFDEKFLSDIKIQLKHLESNPSEKDSLAVDLNKTIEFDEVVDAIGRAKTNKAAGIDGIVSELLKNNTMAKVLHAIFSQCFACGICPTKWKLGLITPIPKSSKNDPRDPMSYRGITLISVVCKVYCDVIRKRLTDWLEANGIIREEQNGFRKNRGCLDHLYTFSSIVQNRKLCKKDTFACFIDAKKAFDRVNRDCLWYKLRSIGIHGAFFNCIKSLYDDVKCAVKVNEHMTQWFDVEIGVKQGCLLSPVLFNIFLNDIVDELNQLKCGIPVLDINIDLLMYADDIVLLAENENSLQRMLNCVSDWTNKWRISLNESKTQVVHFRTKSHEKSKVQFQCCDSILETTNGYKYLGIWFDEFLDFHVSTNNLAAAASRALGLVISKVKVLGGINFDSFTKLYDSFVHPILDYGLWINSVFIVRITFSLALENILQMRLCLVIWAGFPL